MSSTRRANKFFLGGYTHFSVGKSKYKRPFFSGFYTLQLLMGVTFVHSNSSLCFVKSSTNHRPNWAFEGNKRMVLAMASTLPAEQQVNQGQQPLTGDSFLRAHLRKLSPYQSILPFEVCYCLHFVNNLYCQFLLL